MSCLIGGLASCCACSAASCCLNATCSMCGKAVACRKSSATRGVYVFQFIVVAVVAYLFSNWAEEWLKNVPVIRECPPNSTCYGALAVYRITFGLVVYHAFLGLFTIGVSSSSDWRSQIQDGWWPLKFVALLGLTIAAFFIPNSFFIGYGWVVLFGAGIFIILQLVLLIEFGYSWAESWLLKMEEDIDEGSKWYYLLLGSTIFMFSASIALTGVMYAFFCKSGCNLNSFFVTFNLIIAIILALVSLHPKVREGRPTSGLLQSAVIMLYSTYLVFSAIMSESNDPCNTFNTNEKSQFATLILGAVFTIVSVVYSTIRTASSSQEILGTTDVEKVPLVAPAIEETDGPSRIEDDEEETTTYNYSYFHLSFALGAMYICMLLTNWMTISESNDTLHVDNGPASVWIKIVSGWLTFILYGWTLLGPVVLPDREW